MRSWFKNAILFSFKTLPFWLVSGLLVLSSCESEVPIPPLPVTKPKLVVFSLISPEVPGIQVYVTKTVPLQPDAISNQPDLVTDAKVLFSDGQDTLLIPFDPVLKLYSWPHYTVQPDKQYWLSVTSPGGFSAKATCYVTGKINQSLTISIDSTTASGSGTGKSYVVQLNWEDMLGSGDFYKTDAIFKARSPVFPNSPSTHSINMMDVPLARDYQADGRKWQRRSEVLPTEELTNTAEKPDSIYAYLLTTDQPYYDFHNSLYKVRDNNQTVNSFADPVSLYTNVEGGFGLFAAYRSYKAAAKF